jgi:hypothetical protein
LTSTEGSEISPNEVTAEAKVIRKLVLLSINAFTIVEPFTSKAENCSGCISMKLRYVAKDTPICLSEKPPTVNGAERKFSSVVKELKISSVVDPAAALNVARLEKK